MFKRTRLIRSLYARTILMLTVAILIIFSTLGLVYYGIVTITTQRQQAGLLLDSASAISAVVNNAMNTTHTEITDETVRSYITFTARSTGAVVWVINADGELIVNTGIPVEAANRLEKSASSGYYVLPERYLGAYDSGMSGITDVGSFNGLLQGSSRWLSAAFPLQAATGAYAGEIQLHRILNNRSLNSFFMTNSMLVSLAIAFAIALVFFWILSKNITRPIRLLSEAADRVFRGDLSARVVLPGINDKPDQDNDALVTDDLTVLVKTMNTMIIKLENQERDRKDFISSVSHDLRTPITSIKGFVEALLDGTVAPEKTTHYLEIVRQETLRLQTLVETMFESSILESGSQLDQTVFDINDLIKEDVIGLESLLLEKKLGVQTDFFTDEQGCLMVMGDREALSRVVYNIISNAVKFTPTDGIIALTTRRTARSREIEVVIEDSGPGIPDKDLPYVFDRFYKADKSRTAQGSGLGLYICRTILTAHGQKIQATHSELGGSRFIFTLSLP